MTKEQILATVEPRTEKIIVFANSWGENIGCSGFQGLTQEYFTSGNVLDVQAFPQTVILQQISLKERLLVLLQQLYFQLTGSRAT